MEMNEKMKLQLNRFFKKTDVAPDLKEIAVKGNTSAVSQTADKAKDIEETVTVCPKCKQEFNKAEVKQNLNRKGGVRHAAIPQ